MSHPLDRNFYAPYSSTEDAIKHARAINAALKTLSIEHFVEYLSKVLEPSGWVLSPNQIRQIKKDIGIGLVHDPGEKFRLQVLMRHWSEKSRSRNWCLWITGSWISTTQLYVRVKFWTRWNAAFAPTDLEV